MKQYLAVSAIGPDRAGLVHDFTRTVADIISREKLLPVPTVIQNKAGGGGLIAQNYVAGRRGDPYTVFAIASSLLVAVPIGPSSVHLLLAGPMALVLGMVFLFSGIGRVAGNSAGAFIDLLPCACARIDRRRTPRRFSR